MTSEIASVSSKRTGFFNLPWWQQVLALASGVGAWLSPSFEGSLICVLILTLACSFDSISKLNLVSVLFPLGALLCSLPLALPFRLIGFAMLAGVFPFHISLESLSRRSADGSMVLLVFHPAAALARHLVSAIDFKSPGVEHVFEVFQSVLVVSAVVHAGIALVRPDARRAVLAICLSQTSLALSGMFGEETGRLSAEMLMFGSSLGALVLLSVVTEIKERYGISRLADDNGLSMVAPHLSLAMLAMGWLMLGLPGGIVFFAEDLLFHTLLEHSVLATLGFLFSTALNAIAFYRLYTLLFGGVSLVAYRALPDEMRHRVSHAIRMSLVVVVLVVGFFPRILFS